MRLAAMSLRLRSVLHRVRAGATVAETSAPRPWSRDVAPHADAGLFEALNHTLRLSDLLPPGPAADVVRRCVCELIEAGTGADRAARLRVLVSRIADLQRIESGRHHDDGRVASSIERLLDAVRSEVVPLLQAGRSEPGRGAALRSGERALADN